MANGMFSISGLLEEYVIYIPEIQRDYAQGRESVSAEAVRTKLLDDIYEVLQGKKTLHVLNYIYGVPTNDGKIILIDGQQRVTSLFLLKWYLAVKSDADIGFLRKLSYATRDSSREFCEFLNTYGSCIKNEAVPSDVIKNHIKFKKRWLNDPTIANMLNMLDAIDERPNENPQQLYANIDNIKFSFISLDGFKRTDELYAAMNSRGKQLTPFELIKGELLKVDSSLAAIINGEWLPTFWELSRKYARKLPNFVGGAEQYASENHDPFLYNYYSFVVQMIWWIKDPKAAQVKKGDSLPSVFEMTKSIIYDAENRELIKFAMKLVENEFLRDYDFGELIRVDDNSTIIPHDKIVIFDGRSGDSVQFFELCCHGGKEFTQAGRCYLWAYIQYQYDKKNNSVVDNRTLKDYYLLMRSLYMRRASNETPTSIDKLSLNEELMGNVIRPFEEIIRKNNNYKDWSQFKAFYSDNKYKYDLLNNPLVRGSTDNLGEISDDNLNNNLLWLWKADELDCFKRLASCGFSSFRCEVGGYYARVFLPFTKKMLKSLFSLRGWSKSQDFTTFLEYLRKNKLENKSDKTYSCSDWEYYYISYPSFRTGVYGQFEIPDNSQKMSFDAIYIENERATKNKIHNPFLYEVYQQKHTGNISYFNFVEENKLSFERKPTGEFEWKYNGKIYKIDGTKDCIYEFINMI